MKRTGMWLLSLIPFLHTSAQGSTGEKVLIAAAADLRYAMDSLISAYSPSHPAAQIQVVYGSSGNFYEQIRNGAPFDLFFSADLDYVSQLAAQGKVTGPVTRYGTGALVLWSLSIDPSTDGMNGLTNPRVIKIAIANPDHAPYGKRAVESLRYYNLYDRVKDKLVMGENIAQAAQFASSGSADIGIIALSLAVSPPMQRMHGHYWLIPAQSHSRLDQGAAALAHAKGNQTASDFLTFIQSDTAKAIFTRFGLSNPQ